MSFVKLLYSYFLGLFTAKDFNVKSFITPFIILGAIWGGLNNLSLSSIYVGGSVGFSTAMLWILTMGHGYKYLSEKFPRLKEYVESKAKQLPKGD